ncbi:hypothetical protein QE152_g38266 [Popillia japonica]|uniref:CCHC-type domain-containing protein n=1 Tax=Popillia japonica TaxID=7064 RepID=A0AAW1I749_POPJA
MAYQNIIVNLPQLETGNFSNWKFRVETLLDEKGVKDVLVKKEEDFNDNDEKVAFMKRDVQAKSLIIRCISDKHLDLVKDLKTTEQAGSKLDESDKISHLLLTLGDRFSAVITAIETLAPDKLSMEFVKSRFLDEELKTEKPNKTSKNHDGEVTFNATQVICFKCNQNGHKSYECQIKKNFRRGAFNNRGRRARRTGNFGDRRDMQQKNESANQTETNISFVAMTCDSLENKNMFILDSGATNHYVMKTMQKYMSNIRKVQPPINIRTANGLIMTAKEAGEYKTQCQVKLIEKGYEVIFKRDTAIIKGKDFTIKGEINENNLAILTVENESCNAAIGNDKNIWHKRFGHLNKNGLKSLGLPFSNDKCSQCLEGKATRRSFKRIQTYTKEIGDLIHSDISGPVTPSSNDEKYFQVDEYETTEDIENSELEADTQNISEDENRDTEADKTEKTTRLRRTVKRPDYLDVVVVEYYNYTAYCLLTREMDPNSYEDAMKYQEWRESIEKELNSHKKLLCLGIL